MKKVVRFFTVTLLVGLMVLAGCIAKLLLDRQRTGGNAPPIVTMQPELMPTEAPTPEPTPAPTEEPKKTIYLTFDDGPSEHTERLLDLLDAYGVKATFFVTHDYPDYTDMIGEEFRRGHAVGVHAYRHVYGQIYNSTDSFFDSFDRMQDIIVEQTGQETHLFRFPGGSSNEVSNGLMPQLVNLMDEGDVIYFDWDVDGHDATDAHTKDEVMANLVEGAKECKKTCIVLCHDRFDYTVDAMKEFIPWAIDNGFVFDKLSEEAPQVHHKLAED